MNKKERSNLNKRNPFLRSQHPFQQEIFANATSTAEFLSGQKSLKKNDMRRIVEEAIVLLDGFYVHRPLKEAMHAVRPVQALRILAEQIDGFVNDLAFHRAMTRIFTSLRDLHTNYILPTPFNRMVAFLPFLAEPYWVRGQKKILVAHTIGSFEHDTFDVGVEITDWSGVPITRYLHNLAEETAAGNSPAALARATRMLTQRSLAVSLPPDEEWVNIGFLQKDGTRSEIRLEWLLFEPPESDGASDQNTAHQAAFGLDLEENMIQRSNKILFAPDVVAARSDQGWPDVKWPVSDWPDTDWPKSGWPQMSGGAALPIPSPDGDLLPWSNLSGRERKVRLAIGQLDTYLPDILGARAVQTPHGDFAYLRIRTFDVGDLGRFLFEVSRLLALLPQEGVILDVRDNGGGLIHASEGLLQFFTPKRIEPEKFQFVTTPEIRELCRRVQGPSAPYGIDLSTWYESIQQAVVTGADYSRGFPITPPALANALGQVYHGPAVLITNGRCYSATDIFAAGFKDHGIGKIIGTDENTGAGGANVWPHNLLKDLFDNTEGKAVMRALPRGAQMRVSIRRSQRVGPLAGTPLEDLGVQPDIYHRMTKRDILEENTDLIKKASKVLASGQAYRILAELTAIERPRFELVLKTANLDRFDVYLDSRPVVSKDSDPNQNSSHRVKLVIPLEAKRLEIRGFFQGKLIATRRLYVA